MKETRLQYSGGQSRKVLDLYWSELGLTAPFGNNAIVSTKGTKVSHVSLKHTYSVLPYNASYVLKYKVGNHSLAQKQATPLNPNLYQQSAVPIFWSSYPAGKKGVQYHYVGHFRCVGGSEPNCLDFEFEHFDMVLDAKLSLINPDYASVKEDPE